MGMDIKKNFVRVNGLGGAPAVLGIDEAGRGPVLGPIVFCCFYVPIAEEATLHEIGARDSKKLNHAERVSIFSEFCGASRNFGWETVAIDPDEISAKMLGRHFQSLNEISYVCACSMIRRVQDLGVNVSQVRLDAVGPSENYARRLRAAIPNIDIIVAEKADDLYACVSAASICAKVIRDESLRCWEFEEGLKVVRQLETVPRGCGYPSDSLTKEFLTASLHRVHGFPSIVRHSWATAKANLDAAAAAVEWEHEDNSEELSAFPQPQATDPLDDPNVRSVFLKRRGVTWKCPL